MITDRIIICLASDWGYHPTSKHQVMKILARRNFVIWVNYHGSRAPGVNAHDVKSAASILRRAAGGASQINETMCQVTPLLLPGAHGRLGRLVNKSLLVTQIARAIRAIPDYHERPRQVWSFAPDVPHLVGAFDEEAFIYYCVDEHSEFDGYNRSAILQLERQLVERADVVFASSAPLLESRRQWRDDVHLMRHGVDYEHFAQAWKTPGEMPDDLANIPQPIFGFFGLIHHWIDVKLIGQLARLRPEYSFVLLGDAKVSLTKLSELPNVHWLGPKPYSELPAYCRHFRAGLIPFVESTMTRNVNPIKLLEYLAAGLPVISTPMPEARVSSRHVHCRNSSSEFARCCDRFAKEDSSSKETVAVSAADRSWTAVAHQLQSVVVGSIELPQQRGRFSLAPAPSPLLEV